MTTGACTVFKDEVINHITITLSLKERLKVLLGRKIIVSVYTATENKVGGVRGTSDVTVERLFKQRNIGEGAAI